MNHIPAASVPPGATNTTGSVFVGGSNHPDPPRATQGEKSVTYTDLLRMRALRDDRGTCCCPLCRHVTGHGSPGLVWSTLAARMTPTANPSTEETSP